MGARKLGIETFAEKGVVGRGVMIDLERFFGREGRHLVTYDELMRVLEETGATVEEGDLAFFYTGFADLLLEMEREPDGPRLANSCAALDGRDDRLLQWVTDSGVAALFADNYAVEQSPRPAGAGESDTPTRRCTSTACSSSACRWASSGIWAASPAASASSAGRASSRPASRSACRARSAPPPNPVGIV